MNSFKWERLKVKLSRWTKSDIIILETPVGQLWTFSAPQRCLLLLREPFSILKWLDNSHRCVCTLWHWYRVEKVLSSHQGWFKGKIQFLGTEIKYHLNEIHWLFKNKITEKSCECFTFIKVLSNLVNWYRSQSATKVLIEFPLLSKQDRADVYVKILYTNCQFTFFQCLLSQLIIGKLDS